MPPSFSAYLRFLTAPFFKAWWAVITGLASFLSLYVANRSTLTLSAMAAFSVTFLLFTLGFFALSAVAQGWTLYSTQGNPLTVVQFDRNRDVEEGWYLVISGSADLSVGSVCDIHRRVGSAEVPLALVRVTGRNSDGTFQAAPLGRMNPSLTREHAAGRLRPGDLVIRPFVDVRRLRESADVF